MKKRVLISSLLAIAVCISVICGATLAIFAKSSESKIVISSAKVEVDSSLLVTGVKENGETSYREEITPEVGEDESETYYIDQGKQRSITLNKDGTVNVNNIAIGDYVKFELSVTNASTIDVSYRVGVRTDDGELAEYLDVVLKRGDISYEKSSEDYKVTTPYQDLTTEDTEALIYTVEVGIPQEIDADVYGKICSVNVVVEALQGNANPEKVIVRSQEDFAAISGKLGRYFKDVTVELGCDIDYSQLEKKSIFSSFMGVFDGKGHTVKNVNINSTGVLDPAAGLFPSLSGTVQNLTVEGELSGNSPGAISGTPQSNAKIINCINKATINGTGEKGDGISDGKAGGIVGSIMSGRTNILIQNCVNEGTVNGTINGVGGIIGMVMSNKGVTIENCINRGTVGSDGAVWAGGIAGYLSKGDSVIRDCYNEGAVTGSTIGGIAGFLSDNNTTYDIIDCNNSGKLTGTTVGAIVGNENNVGLNLRYTEKTEVINYSIIGSAGSSTGNTLVLENVVGRLDKMAGNVQLMNTEITEMKWNATNCKIAMDDNSSIGTLNILDGNAVIASGSKLRIDEFVGDNMYNRLKVEDDTARLFVNGQEKVRDEASKQWIDKVE